MTAFRIATGIEPVGARTADLAVLWTRLLDGGPSVDDISGVNLSPLGGGTITVHLADLAPLLAWAEHLGGLGFLRNHIGGRTWRVTATGHITRGELSATVQLRANTVDRSAK